MSGMTLGASPSPLLVPKWMLAGALHPLRMEIYHFRIKLVFHFEKPYKTKYDIRASFILYGIVYRYFTIVVSGAQTSEEMEEKILHKLNCDVLPCCGADKFEIFF